MDFKTLVTTPEDPATARTDALLVVLPADKSGWRLPKVLADTINDAVKQGDLELKGGKVLYLHRPAGLAVPRAIVSVAAGAEPKAFKAAMVAGLSSLRHSGARQLTVAWAGPQDLDGGHAEAVVAAAADAVYVYRHTKPSAPKAWALAGVQVATGKAGAPAVRKGLARGQAIAAGVELARECANRPGNHCTPTYLATRARQLAEEGGLEVTVLGQKEVEKLGMGAFLAVARGSHEPLKFIVLRHNGATRKDAPVVLVGKGITFDTGGISIKPSGEMDEMKFDMGGAASVLGTLRALSQLEAKINVVGLIPCCENMPGGSAIKPGDVVTSLSGQTIEILNTDAEGRLILCDALTYAERFKPAAVVDIATLTGACVIALGHHNSGLFSPDDGLAQQLLEAGRSALDPAWRLPLDDEYDDALKTNFADMANVGGRPGGAITAARFLRKFTGKYTWAHLDIAGTAWKSGAAKGATGRPVPLLTHFLLARAGW